MLMISAGTGQGPSVVTQPSPEPLVRACIPTIRASELRGGITPPQEGEDTTAPANPDPATMVRIPAPATDLDIEPCLGFEVRCAVALAHRLSWTKYDRGISI